MIVETPVESPAPVVLGAAPAIPESARGVCDTWGNFLKEPLKTIEETHGTNFIKIFIYQHETGFYYGYQLKLDRVIKQKRANVTDTPIDTEDKARGEARRELIALTSEKKLRKIFLNFDKICYNQPELF